LGISAFEFPLRTPCFILDRQLYLPVSIPYRVGEQTAEEVWASVNFIPSAASRSIFGVMILPFSLKADTSP
jgi:hypothetical protein